MPDIISPIDGQPCHSFELLDEDTVGQRLALAAATQRAFRDSPIAERAALCRRMLDAYRARGAEYAEQITRMMGKPLGQASGEFERTMV
jgi:acyl-CoA reductase-like NAD-dependent aldehyde dehydrogenase